MLLSVVIPLYNKDKTVLKTIKSVLSQTYTDFEIIVINDGSTDNSLKIVEKIKDERIKIFSQKNKGVSSARNYGIKKSKARWIAFLDADDYWDSHFLEEFYDNILLFDKASFFFCLSFLEDIVSATITYDKSFLIENYYKQIRKYGISPNSSSVMVKRDVFLEIGVFDENISVGEDTDMWYRILWKYDAVYIPTSLSYVFLGESNWMGESNKVSHWFSTYHKWLKKGMISKRKQRDFRVLYSKELLKFLLFGVDNPTFRLRISKDIILKIPTLIKLFFIEYRFVKGVCIDWLKHKIL